MKNKTLRTNAMKLKKVIAASLAISVLFFNDFQSTILGFRSFIKNGMVWHYDPSFILACCHIFALIYIPGILF